ncbi:MAG: hypothetical protein Q8Q54_03815, partial [Methylococcales bacterium]|nr:hypothetical protein [Methylococcales bacterium]
PEPKIIEQTTVKDNIAATVETPASRTEPSHTKETIVESYTARLSSKDHFNSDGASLKSVADIIRQDRANYHKFNIRDNDDTGDNFFNDKDNRERIAVMLEKGHIDKATSESILNSTPVVLVNIYNNYIEVSLQQKPNNQPENTLEFPAGLRLPTVQELAKETLRQESPTQNAKVTADFNGDGKVDYAFLLAGINTSKGALAIKLSNNNSYEWKIIDGDIDWNSSTQMSIDLAEPNKYETACGKGYWECAVNEPSNITLKNAGILYTPFEQGGAKMIFWNSAKNDFTQIVMND